MTQTTENASPEPCKLLLINGEWILAEEPHATRLMDQAERVMVEGDAAYIAYMEQRRKEVIDNQVTTMRKFREALIVSDIPLADVVAAIESIPDPKQKALVQNYWETETKVRYGDVHTQKIRELLSLNLDKIFQTTKTL